jgi:hypothetical protein
MERPGTDLTDDEIVEARAAKYVYPDSPALPVTILRFRFSVVTLQMPTVRLVVLNRGNHG